MRKIALVAAAAIALCAHAQAQPAGITSRLVVGAALANVLGKTAAASMTERMTIEEVAAALAERHNRDRGSQMGDNVVASTAHSQGRYVFIENTLKLKPNLSDAERREFSAALRKEMPREFCKALAPALDVGIVYMVSYYSTHGQYAAGVRLGREECH